jgi:hypothetical protein
MNTKSLFTRIGVPVLSLGLLGGLGATMATSASAAVKPVTVTANTHLNNHPDTTNNCNVGLIQGDCVWAHDNATEKFTLVQTAPGSHTWNVTVDYVGSFHGFADPTGPNAGAALDSNGSVKGTITYQATSLNNDPDPSLLPGQSASDAHISDNIQALFNNTATITGGDHYTFSYQNGNYVQNGAPANTTTGDVSGH